MSRLACFGLFTLLLTLGLLGRIPVGRTGPKDARKPKVVSQRVARAESKAAALVKKLTQRITLEKGIETNTPFQEALDLLSKMSGIKILINAASFKEENAEPGAEVDFCPVKFPPTKDIPLATVLRLILAAIPPNGATYVVRGDWIEITTLAYAEPRHLLQQTVVATFAGRSLTEALQEVSDSSGVSIVIDPRVSDKAKSPITATLKNNVSVETAVRLLADMAGLKAVVVGGGLYVTTTENAARLQAEEEKRAAALPRRKAPKRKRLTVPFGLAAGPPPVEALIAILKDKEEDRADREAVADDLSRRGAEAVPALIEALKDRQSVVRKLAARALGGVGPKAKDAWPHLILALKDRKQAVRKAAADALKRIDVKKAIKEAIP